MEDRVYGDVQYQRGRRKWRKAFLRCHSGRLAYFESMSSDKCLGVIPLNSEFYDLEDVSSSKKYEKQPYVFRLTEKRTGKYVSFMCDNDKQKSDFMGGIKIEMGLERDGRVSINDEYQAALKKGGLSSLTVSPRVEVELFESDVNISSIVGHFVSYSQRLAMDMVNGILRGELTTMRKDGGEDLGVRVRFLNLGRDDPKVLKGVLNEVNGVRYLIQQRKYRTTRVAVFAVVDFLGFRILASSGPIATGANLEYGKLEGGDAVEPVKQILPLVDEIAEAFNLEEKADYDIRLFRDEVVPANLYLTNVGQLLVPDGKKAAKHAKMRLEATCHWERPISLSEPLEEAEKARSTLNEVTIPDTVHHLESIEAMPIDSITLTRYLHSCGIKMYHLGYMCKLATLPHLTRLFEVEMVSRSCKTIINTSLRKIVREGNIAGDDVKATPGEIGGAKKKRRVRIEYKYVDFLNLVLGSSRDSVDFWDRVIHDSVKAKFGHDVSSKTKESLAKPQLLLALQYHCGIEMSDEDFDYSAENPFQREHFKRGIAKVKSPNIVSGAELVEDEEWKSLSALNSFDGVKATETKIRRFNAVTLGIEDLMENILDSASLLSQHAMALVANKNVDEAISAAERAMDVGGVVKHPRKSYEASLALISAFMAKKDDEKANEIYYAGIANLERQLGENHPILISLHSHMAGCYASQKRHEDACKCHIKALEVAVSSLGMKHPLTANAYMVAGRLFLRSGDQEKALKHLEKAIVAFDWLDSRWTNQILLREISADSVREYAEALMDAGKTEMAVVNARKSLELLRKKEDMLGVEDKGQYAYSVVSACRMVANFHTRSNDLAAASKQWEEVVQLMKLSRDVKSQDSWWYEDEKKSIRTLFEDIRAYLKVRFHKILIDDSDFAGELESWKSSAAKTDAAAAEERDSADAILSELFTLNIAIYFDDILSGCKEDKEKREKLRILHKISYDDAVFSH